MNQLKNIKSLERYDAWKKQKKSRKNYLDLIGGTIGILLGVLITWLVIKVHPGDVWTLGKGVFVNKEKILEINPQIDKVEQKIKKSIAGGALKWVSKKLEEETAQQILSGNLEGAVNTFRTYCLIMIGIWLVFLSLISGLLGWLTVWIIGKYWWPEPTLTQTFIEEEKKTIEF